MLAQDHSLRETNWPSVASYVSARKDTYPFIDPAAADLTGKSVLITGASKGIGRATAISFATAGCSRILLVARSDMAHVEAAVRDAASKANRPRPLVRSIKADITSEASVRAASETAADVLGGSLDILISNAGYLEEWKPLVESTPSEWWWTWEVNIKGSYLVARYLVPLLLESPTKTLINITSGGAHVLFPGASGYQTTKFALCRLTEFIDKEYHQQGLVAIAVHPGGIKTELAMNMPPDRQSVLTDPPALAADTLVWLARERRDWLRQVRLCQLGHGGAGAEEAGYSRTELAQVSGRDLSPAVHPARRLLRFYSMVPERSRGGGSSLMLRREAGE